MNSKVITHKNLQRWLKKLEQVPWLQDASAVQDPNGWEFEEVTLEFPLGEISQNAMKTLALLSRDMNPKTTSLTGKEGFNAQGLEGKLQIKKPLLNALFNLRDLLPEFRGRIIRGKA